MSPEDKLRSIEQLSVSLTNSDSDLESPSWHHDALRQTAQRYEGTRSCRLLVSALGFALLASIAPSARAANPPDDLAKFLFLTQLGDMPDNAVVCPSFAWKPIPAALLQSLQVADSRFVRVDECVKVMDVRIGSYHRPSSRHAYFFSIHDFRMLADGRAVAKIDQYFNGKWATYETVEVRESAGQWSLVGIFDRWKS